MQKVVSKRAVASESPQASPAVEATEAIQVRSVWQNIQDQTVTGKPPVTPLEADADVEVPAL